MYCGEYHQLLGTVIVTLKDCVELLTVWFWKEPLLSVEEDGDVDGDLEECPDQDDVPHVHLSLVNDKIVCCEEDPRYRGQRDAWQVMGWVEDCIEDVSTVNVLPPTATPVYILCLLRLGVCHFSCDGIIRTYCHDIWSKANTNLDWKALTGSSFFY